MNLLDLPTVKYRSRLEIISTILRTAMEGATKTKIMYMSYLSYEQSKEYLQFLQERGLLEYKSEEEVYRITEKAIRFLKTAQEMNEILPSRDINDDIDHLR